MSSYVYKTTRRGVLLAKTVSYQVRLCSGNFRHLEVLKDENNVAIVTMKRAPVNSLNTELLTEISSVLTDLEETKCSGMILTSVGILRNRLSTFYRYSFPTKCFAAD
uniref:Uncharacterized protein n=1 Tax=Photinus pyralis TaxID=7054 RepID=A0A1Y1K6A0_PHOPY